jgi:hypothetical protein
VLKGINMNKIITQLNQELSNALERINDVNSDLLETPEPDTDLTAAVIHGLLREISDQTIQALCIIQRIQREARVNGYQNEESN